MPVARALHVGSWLDCGVFLLSLDLVLPFAELRILRSMRCDWVHAGGPMTATE
jgi:hypothetical protein